MPELHSQEDIVREFMARQETGYEVMDEVRIPGLETHFNELPVGAGVKVDTVRVPRLDELAYKSRLEIAEVIVGLFNYRPGVVGFKWVFGEQTLRVKYVDGFEQRIFETENEYERIMSLVQLILKVRRNMIAIEWNFGEDNVKITYTA